MNIDTSLLRERFVIEETVTGDNAKPISITAPSTRMPVSLQSGTLPAEKFVVRGHNMQSTVRIVSHMITEYEKRGPLLTRTVSIDWEELWDNSLNPYERIYNPDRWVAVYNKGKIIYATGKHHAFLDVIEQCDIVNKSDYDQSIKLAEKSFLQAGRGVDIIYDSNMALVSVIGATDSRCSMVLRGPNQTNTLNFSLKTLDKKQKINITQGLSAAADFFEGAQLCYLVGFNNEKIARGWIEKYSDDYKQNTQAKKRLKELDIAIDGMEKRYKVRYRPERPDFEHTIEMTQHYASHNIVYDAPEPEEDGDDADAEIGEEYIE